MSKQLSFLFLCIIGICTVQGQQWPNVRDSPCRPGCCTWTPQPDDNTTDSPTPRGFAASVLKGTDLMLSNPCITATAENTNQYVEVAVESQESLANYRLCAGVNGTTRSCGNRQARYCRKVDQRSLIITISCDTGCQETNDVSFFYRVTFSPANVSDNEYWCDNAVEYPSSLLQVVPPSRITPPTTAPSSAFLNTFSLLAVGITMILALLLC